jgi:hypothetical protein
MFQVMVPIGRCCRRPTGLFNDGEPTFEWTVVIFFDALDAEDVLWDSLEEEYVLYSPVILTLRFDNGLGQCSIHQHPCLT